VSPDGNRIAFNSDRGEASSTASADSADSAGAKSASPRPSSFSCLRVANIDGSDQQTLVNGFDRKRLLGDLAFQPAWKPVWSPDSKKIAFNGWSNSPHTSCNIYVVNANGSGSPTRLMTQPNDCHSISISTWSPDGKKIAGEVGQIDAATQIYVIGVLGGEDRDQPLKLTQGPVENIQPAWSPNGTEIAFVHYDEIYKMNADGSEVTRLTHSPDYSDFFLPGHPTARS
jgi:Tol biopolymer transport system component